MAKKTNPAQPATDPPAPAAQFEQALEALEQLVQQMERGELSLDDSLAAYERGVALYRQCQSALDAAELRVRLLDNPAEPEHAEPFAADVD